MKSKIIRAISLLSVSFIALVAISNTAQAWASTGSGYTQTILASDEIKNNPAAMKILQNIELSKQRISEQHQKQLGVQQDQKFIEEQRAIAKQYLQRDLVQLNGANSHQVPIDFTAFNSGVGNQAKLVDAPKQNHQQVPSQQYQSQSYSISGATLKNDPVAQKILNEIEYSKQKIAQLQKDKKELALIEQQRLIAKSLEEQALQSLQMKVEVNSSKNSFDRFLSSVQNNSTKKVFAGQFDLMQSRLDAGHIAMKRILDNGGTWQDAINEFSKYAGVKRIEMIQTNKNLNVQNGLSDPVVQTGFDKNGMLPDDYIKFPAVVLKH
ncbi:MAG: hypothetical protein E6K98_00570 [Thaumarchaeota archaeon]|nr:MAG: hypothetical protein E6K98_00570 [Nitrososphaerota archaeon]